MANAFGKDFLSNLGRELDRQSIHGSDRGKERPQSRRRQSRIPGEPGSPERMEYVASQIPDPELRAQLVSELAWTSVGTHLRNCLHQIRAHEESDYFDGTYPPEIQETFASAARMLASTGSPELYQAFAYELGETGSELTEYLPDAVQYAEREGHFENYELARAQDEARMERRHQMLEGEYADIRRRTGEVGLQAADQLAQGLAEDGTLYHPDADDDRLRVSLRSIAEKAKVAERGQRQGEFLDGFDRELSRVGAPGSSWNDEDRARWEAEQAQASAEIIARNYPEDIDHQTVTGLMADDRRRISGKSDFERSLDAEFEKMDEHNQRAPHKRAMAAEYVKEFEETHTATGESTVAYDGHWNEHGGRYD